MSSIGKISLDLNVNSKKFNKQVDGIEKHVTKSFGSMQVAIGNILSNLAQKALASIGTFVKDSIDKGSELSELQNVVDSVFTTMSDKVEEFAQSALDSYGLTEGQAKKMVGTFGAMAKAFGYTEEQAFGMSTTLAALAGDVASFYNLSVDEAYTKLKGVFTGETEALKELGVVMTQAALDEFALANGFGKTTDKMTEQEKVALRLAFIQDKLSAATGDVIRTQDSWANQTRKLSGQIESFKAAIGQGLINILTPVINVINTLMGKLVELANAFKSFTEFVMGSKGGSGAGAAMNEVAEAAGAAADATGGIEASANGAASAAKKAQKSLMGFDEINKLQKKDDSGSGGGNPLGDLNFEIPIEKEGKAADKAISPIKAKLLELLDLLKQGFTAGLGDDFGNSIERMRAHVDNMGVSMRNMFSDGSILQSASEMVDKIIYSFGQVTGSVTSIGTTIAEFFIGSIDGYLSQNSGFIKDRLIGIFDVAGDYYSIAGNLSQAIASIFEVFRGGTAKQIGADLIGIFSNAYLGVVQLTASFSRDLLNNIAQPIIDNKDKIKEAIENTLSPISTILSTLNNSVKTTFEKIFEVYEQYVHPAFERMASGMSSMVSVFLNSYNSYIAPMLDNLASKFTEVWTGHIQPAVNKALELFGKVAELISRIWQSIIVPAINWISTNIIPVVAPIIETIISMIMGLFGAISDIIGGIFKILGGLIDYIIGMFTGDWERAWDGVKSIFSGIWDAIAGIFSLVWETIKGIVKSAFQSIIATITLNLIAARDTIQGVWETIKHVFGTYLQFLWNSVKTAFFNILSTIRTVLETIRSVITTVFNGIWSFISGIINTILGGIEYLVNGVIGGLNSMINAMNSLSFDVPDWVPEIGGQQFGFSIPTIPEVALPRLAEGGYVKANQPQPVVIGDNKTQGEIVSPEDKMLAITMQALEQFFSKLKDSGYSSKGNGEVGDIIIPIYLDGSMLDEVIVTAQQRRNMRSGGM